MDLAKLLIAIPPLFLAVILHEVMHGYVAYRLGDPTAKHLGRLTLNPIAHIDPFGTLLIPLFLFLTGAPFLFGYAKPVPVNFFRLRNPKRDMIWVAAAGPLTNLTVAAICGIIFRFFMLMPNTDGIFIEFFIRMFHFSVVINVLLALFNLIPIPPLDGGRILVGSLPHEKAAMVSRLEPYGMFLVIFLIWFNPFGTASFLWHFMTILSEFLLGV